MEETEEQSNKQKGAAHCGDLVRCTTEYPGVALA